MINTNLNYIAFKRLPYNIFKPSGLTVLTSCPKFDTTTNFEFLLFL